MLDLALKVFVKDFSLFYEACNGSGFSLYKNTGNDVQQLFSLVLPCVLMFNPFSTLSFLQKAGFFFPLLPGGQGCPPSRVCSFGPLPVMGAP